MTPGYLDVHAPRDSAMRWAAVLGLAAASGGNATCVRGYLLPTLLLAGYGASGTTTLCYDMKDHLPFVRCFGSS